jgi:hypothetical protein
MSQNIVFLHSLKSGVDPAAYERWVLEVDFPLTKRQPGVISYEVTPLTAAVKGAEPAPFQYLEVIEVEDPVAYQRNTEETEDLEFKQMMGEWADYVDRYVGSVGPPLR